MQIIPSTAEQLAGELQLKYSMPERLFDAEMNINMGTYYLRKLLDRYEQRIEFALAAYNAGPHRVKRWLPERTQEADVWVETIPFKETRNYVKRVMAYSVIYEKRLGLEPGSIVQRMRPIRGPVEQSSNI